MIYIEYNNIVEDNGDCTTGLSYYGECGWNTYLYNDVARKLFTFNNGNGLMDDTYYLNAGAFETSLAQSSSAGTSAAELIETTHLTFAGLICIEGTSKIFFMKHYCF